MFSTPFYSPLLRLLRLLRLVLLLRESTYVIGAFKDVSKHDGAEGSYSLL